VQGKLNRGSKNDLKVKDTQGITCAKGELGWWNNMREMVRIIVKERGVNRKMMSVIK